MADAAGRAFRTRGQPGAAAAVSAMLEHGVPHAVLLVGPPGVGKTTLALDLAAALLCQAPSAARPCGTCRSCRAVRHGNHPDLHRLAPAGAGHVIPIGGRDERGVRDLVAELALLPVEGGARVAVAEAAHRMTEDAQSAFLKTLEEPPRGATIILAADDEERLLPTIRSRTARIRLGPVPRRDIESIVVEHGLADASDAARYARLAAGRPGLALAYAAAPEAAVIRGEIARSLLDLRGGSRTDRLTGVRALAARAAELAKVLELGAARLDAAQPDAARLHEAGDAPKPTARTGRAAATASRRSRSATPATTAAGSDADPSGSESGSEASLETDSASVADAAPVRVPAAERRAGALVLVDVWRDLLRDLAALVGGEARLVRDVGLLDDLEAAAGSAPSSASQTAIGGLDEATIGRALARLDVAGEQLEGNVSPELVLDVLALRLAA